MDDFCHWLVANVTLYWSVYRSTCQLIVCDLEKYLEFWKHPLNNNTQCSPLINGPAVIILIALKEFLIEYH